MCNKVKAEWSCGHVKDEHRSRPCERVKDQFKKDQENARAEDLDRLNDDNRKIKAWDKKDLRIRGPRPVRARADRSLNKVLERGRKYCPIRIHDESLDEQIPRPCDACASKSSRKATPPKDKKPGPKPDRRSDREKEQHRNKLWGKGKIR